MAASGSDTASNPTFKAVGISLAVGSGYVQCAVTFQSSQLFRLFIGTSFVLYLFLGKIILTKLGRKRGYYRQTNDIRQIQEKVSLILDFTHKFRFIIFEELDMVGRNE